MEGLYELPDQLFAGEHDCVSYLFWKRWPQGFCCPFCGKPEKDVFPAASVVCRYCGKKTSVTAGTILHGTRKSLLNWMRISWLFCGSKGISAREVQKLMVISNYQSCWDWLRKLRLAVSVIESKLCRGTVVVDCLPFDSVFTTRTRNFLLLVAQELDRQLTGCRRLRCVLTEAPVIDESSPFSGLIASTVSANASLLLGPGFTHFANSTNWKNKGSAITGIRLSAGDPLIQSGRDSVAELEAWLVRLYRRAVEPKYLQGYIDEFTFRWNRRDSMSQMLLFDELTTSLISPRSDRPRKERPQAILREVSI